MQSAIRTPRRRSALRLLAAVAAGGLIATALAACSGGSGSDTTQQTLTIGMAQTANNMDPHTASPAAYVFPAYATPIYLAPDGDLVPDLATEWGYTDDQNTTFEFTLRDGVTFSDGDTLDADAVVASLERFLDLEGNQNLASAGPVSAITAVDDDTVRISYSEPFPNAALSLTQDYNFGFIISPTGLADPDSLMTESHGAGQYVLDASQTVIDSVYTFTPNANYWNPDAVKFSEVVLKPTTDPAAQLAALESGEIDYAMNMSAINVASAVSAGFVNASGAGQIWYLMLQARDAAPLSDSRVREAISLAIDRDAIVSSVFQDLGEPLSSNVAPGQLGSYQTEVTAQDIAQAKELLAEAGYADGFTLTALDTDALDANSAFAVALQGQLAQVGITLNLDVASGSFDTFLGSLFAGTDQTTAFPLQNINLYSQYLLNLTAGSIANLAGSTDDAVSAAVAETAMSDEDTQDAAYTDLAKALDDALWNVPVALAYTNHPHVASLENFAETSVQMTPDGFAPDASLSWQFAAS
ncbi:MAG: ABC transporter substrate-binding protein [Microbacterium sp.]|uniref:ABC transporter substrate-binding protein n=1 Tax=Microbacterium sp. TaxID=51671 RepID=UPI0039E51245